MHNQILLLNPHLSRQEPSNSTFNKVCTIHMQAIWHFRLNHLSHERLTIMSQLYSNIHQDNKVISYICHFSRQKKLPQHSSTSKASSYFELIHFDIWGLLTVNSIHGHKYFLLSLMILADMYGSYFLNPRLNFLIMSKTSLPLLKINSKLVPNTIEQIMDQNS